MSHPSVTPELSDPQGEGIHPCEHMTHLINSLSDDTLHGPAKLYTKFHAWHCGQCGVALRRLRELRHRMQTLQQMPLEPAQKVLPASRREALQNAMDALETEGRRSDD